MNITEQQMMEVDDNERKARAILKCMIFALCNDADAGEDINVLGLVESASDYLEKNNKIFSVGL